MSRDPIDYQQLILDSLREVVRRALEIVAESGLPGDHHFYISFATEAAGVEVPDDLAARYPEEITVVLQHRYRDLEVWEDAFAVTLYFGGLPRRILVPWAALTGFTDPSVQFGLRFVPEEPAEGTAADTETRPDEDAGEGGGDAPRAVETDAPDDPPKPTGPRLVTDPHPPSPDDDAPKDNVVRFDAAKRRPDRD